MQGFEEDYTGAATAREALRSLYFFLYCLPLTTVEKSFMLPRRIGVGQPVTHLSQSYK